MIERLTYLCGLAVAIVSWAIGQLVADLTAVPTLYRRVTIEAVASTSAKTLLELHNLSRSRRIAALEVNIKAVGCAISADRVLPKGPEWTLEAPPRADGVTVASLMPGSQLLISVGHEPGCKVDFSFGFRGDTTVRIIAGGLESFLLFHWLMVIIILLTLGAIVFMASLAKAYLLARSAARP